MSVSSRTHVPPGAIVVFGGRSEIGVEVAIRLGVGRIVVLAVRPGSDASIAVDRVRSAGANEVAVMEFDADDTVSHSRVVAEIEERFGEIGVAVLAFGILGDQSVAEQDPAAAVRILHTDFVAQASLLIALACVMRPRGRGTLVAFSSVAGQRVRKANFVYGSAKAGLDGFASGLADSLHGSGVHVLIPRPGFVIGRMTQGLDPAPFSSTPAQVAEIVADHVRRGKGVDIWIPWQLRAMYAGGRYIPRALWRKMPR